MVFTNQDIINLLVFIISYQNILSTSKFIKIEKNIY
jgi:hypothetical protein